MKYRWASFIICAVLGLVLLAIGLLVPSYLRALDAGVAQSAGQNSSTLVDDGQMLAGQKRLGAAQLVLQAARLENINGSESFAANLGSLLNQFPAAAFWGDDPIADNLFHNQFHPADENVTMATFIIRRENREMALARLQHSANGAVKELLQTRAVNQTAIFSPSSSAAGQAFDAAVATTGLLLEGGHLTGTLSDEIAQLAAGANHGEGSRSLEQMLLDMTSLSERFNWDQLTAVVAHVPDVATLGHLAEETRRAGEQLPVLFTVVQLSGQPAFVVDYLKDFPGKGLAELGASLRYGAGGVTELARSGEQFYNSSLERAVTVYQPFSGISFVAARLAVQHPLLARAAKWTLYFLAGFFLALALHYTFASGETSASASGVRYFRAVLFAAGFLLVVLMLTEPFLSQDVPKESFTLRLLPMGIPSAFPAEVASLKHTLMNPTVIITMLVFLVLQALIYISCLVKLGEIRRQEVPARIKLKLLENEDHLFDAGLYLGFVGTIISLIVASLATRQVSLIAAYSATSFGIIFVVIFKIFHLRPARRALLMEAEEESQYAENQVPAGTTTVLRS